MDEKYKAKNYRIVNNSADFWNNFVEAQFDMPISEELPDVLTEKLHAAVSQAIDKMEAAAGSTADICSLEMEAWMQIETDENGGHQYGIMVIVVDMPECKNSMDGYIPIRQDEKCFAEFKNYFMEELEKHLFRSERS